MKTRSEAVGIWRTRQDIRIIGNFAIDFRLWTRIITVRPTGFMSLQRLQTTTNRNILAG